MKLLQLITCTLLALLPFNSRNAQAQEALPRIALSSNLLSWATLAPNIGVEVYIGKKLSIAADGSYGMWNYSHTHSSMQTWSVGGEARYWLQTRQYGFRRTYIGLSVRGGEYDHYKRRTPWRSPAGRPHRRLPFHPPGQLVLRCRAGFGIHPYPLRPLLPQQTLQNIRIQRRAHPERLRTDQPTCKRHLSFSH